MIVYIVMAFLTFLVVRYGLEKKLSIPVNLDIDTIAVLAGIIWPIVIAYVIYSHYAK